MPRLSSKLGGAFKKECNHRILRNYMKVIRNPLPPSLLILPPSSLCSFLPLLSVRSFPPLLIPSFLGNSSAISQPCSLLSPLNPALLVCIELGHSVLYPALLQRTIWLHINYCFRPIVIFRHPIQLAGNSSLIGKQAPWEKNYYGAKTVRLQWEYRG